MDTLSRHALPVALGLAVAACSTVALAAPPPSLARPATLVGIDSACRPAYPPAALRERAQGTTLVNFSIDPQGKVVRSAVATSSGPTPAHRALDEEAAATLAHCPFAPAQDDDGHPIPGYVQVRYDWVIEDTGPGTGSSAQPARLDADDPACRPAYPDAAVQAHADGVSALWYRIDARGHVVESHVVHPSGPTPAHDLLDRTALAALTHCPITPGVDAAGRPVETVLQVSYRWQIQPQ